MESKSIFTDIANNIIKVFQVDRFREIVNSFVRKKYDEGASEVETKFGFNIGFGNQQRDVSQLEQYTFDNVKGITDDMQARLRQELQRGLMGNETPKQLRGRIADVFKGSNPTRFKFEDRIKMIARTEGKRAANMAKYNNVVRLGRKGMKKYLDVKMDNRTSDICKAENRKYGEIEKAIPLEKDFTVTVGGKTYSELYPPFHVSCRSSLVITQQKGE